MKDISFVDTTRFPETSWRRAQRRRQRDGQLRSIVLNVLMLAAVGSCLLAAWSLYVVKWTQR